MPADHSDPYAFATLGCRAGTARSSERENSDPIYATSSFSFESAAQAAAVFAGAEDGNIYSRFGNPTVRAFEERLAPRHEERAPRQRAHPQRGRYASSVKPTGNARRRARG